MSLLGRAARTHTIMEALWYGRCERPFGFSFVPQPGFVWDPALNVYLESVTHYTKRLVNERVLQERTQCRV